MKRPVRHASARQTTYSAPCRGRRRLRQRAGAATLTLGCLVAIAGSASAKAPSASAPLAQAASGKSSITVAIAYPSPPAAMLAQFTKQTGVSVHWVNVGWDDLQTKIVAASTAHSYFADVTDVDWSKVGEYHDLNWFYPLNSYFSVSQLSKQMPQLGTFVDDGRLVGLPMDSSMLITTMNTVDFKKAGIKTAPTTMAQYTADLRKLRSSKVALHPLDIPLQAQEGLSTYWYQTTAAFGGRVLTPQHKAAFTSPSSPGYKALAWIVNAFKSRLVPAGNINLSDYAALESDMAHNLTASALSEYSGDIATIYDIKSDSSVVGQVKYIPTPSSSGTAVPNLGNPDGVGVPRTAHNVKGAIEFIKWLTKPQNQAVFAGADGGKDVIEGFPMPAEYSANLALEKSLHGAGDVNEQTKLLKSSQPVFVNGAPAWYSQFSNAVYTNIHAAASGSESVAAAISAIAQVVKSNG